MMKVFVTGGAGQVGSTVIDMLSGARRRGCWRSTISRPGVSDNLTKHANLTLVEDTIADASVINGLFSDFRPEVVVHTAASYKDPETGARMRWSTRSAPPISPRRARPTACHAADLFPDGALLRHQADPVADHARSSDQSGEFELRDLEDGRRELRAVLRRRMGDVPSGQRDRPAQRVRVRCRSSTAGWSKGRSASSRRPAATSAMPATSPRVVVQAADGEGHGTYHFSSGKDVAIRELYDAVVRAMKINDYPEPEVKPLGPDDAPSILLDPERERSRISAMSSSRRWTRSPACRSSAGRGKAWWRIHAPEGSRGRNQDQ